MNRKRTYLSVKNEAFSFEVTSLYDRTLESDKRIIINRGGTRSSKTWSLGQLFVKELLTGENKVLSVVRTSWPALRDSAMRDVLRIIEEIGFANKITHRKTERVLSYGSNIMEFISISDPHKVRGRKRTHLWINEADDCTFEEFQQLLLRTTGRIYLDFNPDDINSWINTELEQKGTGQMHDVEVIVSNYKHNCFLDETSIREVEYLQSGDEDFWTIFGTGEYGKVKGLVFEKYEVVEAIPPTAELVAYGMDFGYSTSHTALVEVYRQGDNLYINELLYRTMLTNPEILSFLKDLDMERSDEVIADAAEPKSIEEFYRMGINIIAALKGPDSIRSSIDILRRYTLHITASSSNLLKELRNYKWQTDKNGNILNKPRNILDHAIDALRYVALNKLKMEGDNRYLIL
ncbi:MAG TPA: phage terminase large subunit [Bacteroidia bacterium]|nr:phage terminase large subunit [Bacteroidia bacterium]